MDQTKVAVFIDFENVAISAQENYGAFNLNSVMSEAERWGNCVIRRAYADWTRFRSHADALMEHSVELTQLFPMGNGRQRKNAVDIQLVVDALETALSKPEVDTFFLVGGDSDYTAVARRLRSLGRQVVGLGVKGASSDALVNACDEFVYYENLGGGSSVETVDEEEARGLLIETLSRNGHERMLAAALKHSMLSIDGRFDEVALGYPQFKDFLESQSDLVKIEQEDQQLWVRPNTDEGGAFEEDETSPYRSALRSAELRPFEGRSELRAEVLQDLHRLLEDFPGEFSLPECVIELVARYDAEEVARDRNLVRDIVKLARFSDLFDPAPESFQLDPLTLAEGTDEDRFLDRCESIYLRAILESNLEADSALLADLLFDGDAATPRVDFLLGLAREDLGLADEPEDDEVASWDWPEEYLAQAELKTIIDEIESCSLDETPSVARAAALSDRGHAVRPKSFEQAKLHFQQAARMTLDLLREGAPGASRTDLENYTASYCFAAAGAHYLGYEYARACQYYLAFFNLLDERRPVWDKMYGLVPPMLSYYFSTVLRSLREPVASSPGFTHPANMAILLHEHENPEARERWMELLGDLRRVNPLMLRLVAERLTQLEQDKGELGAAETRQTLAEVA